MFYITRAITIVIALAAACSQSALGMDEDTQKVLIGAAAVAGIAAIAHSHHHHDSGKHHQDEKHEAVFERGYRDGLQNARYNNYTNDDAYTQGYNAGIDERQAHVHHNQPNRWPEEQHAASNYLMHTCALAVARHFDVNPGHVIPQESTRKDHHEYQIRLKYGHHRHAICRIRENGEVKRIKDDR